MREGRALYKDDEDCGRGLTPTAAWREGGAPYKNEEDIGRGPTPTAAWHKGGVPLEGETRDRDGARGQHE